MSVKNKLFLALTACLMLPAAYAQSPLSAAAGSTPNPPAGVAVPSVRAPAEPAAVGSVQRQQARVTLEQMAQRSNPAFSQLAQTAKPQVVQPSPVSPSPAAMPALLAAPAPQPILVAVTGKPGRETAQIALGDRLYTAKPGSKIGNSKWALERIDVAQQRVVLAHAVGRHHIKDVAIWFVRPYESEMGSPSGSPVFSRTTRFTRGAYGAVPTLPPPVTANYR